MISLPRERLQEISKKAKQRVIREYNWDGVVKKTEEVYQKVLKTPK
jgi:glycosyltransferase involved in cell wall biosynthesis